MNNGEWDDGYACGVEEGLRFGDEKVRVALADQKAKIIKELLRNGQIKAVSIIKRV